MTICHGPYSACPSSLYINAFVQEGVRIALRKLTMLSSAACTTFVSQPLIPCHVVASLYVCNVFVQESRVTAETYPTCLHMLQNICVIVNLQRQRAMIKRINVARLKVNLSFEFAQFVIKKSPPHIWVLVTDCCYRLGSENDLYGELIACFIMRCVWIWYCLAVLFKWLTLY